MNLIKLLMYISILPILFFIYKRKDNIGIIVLIICIFNIDNYLDTIIFMILYILSTYFVDKKISNILKETNKFESLDFKYGIKKKKKVYYKTIKDLSENDEYILLKDDISYFDSMLLSGRSKFINIFTGLIVNIYKNQIIPAGYKSIEKDVKVKIIKDYKKTDLFINYNYFNKYLDHSKRILHIPNLIIIILSFIFLLIFISISFITKGFPSIYLYYILFLILLNKYLKLFINYYLIKLFNMNIYFRDFKSFFNLTNIRNIYFAKSGVITTGEYRITKIGTNNKDELFYYMAHGEYNLNNNLAVCIKNYINVDVDPNKIKNFKYEPSRGLTYKIDKDIIYIGNYYYLKDNNIFVDKQDSLGTILYCFKNKELIGYMVISDSIKKTMKKNLSYLKELNINSLCILSGDNMKMVSCIAKEVGIKNYYSNSTTKDKIFWYNYNKNKYKGLNLYLRNSKYDDNVKIGDIVVDFNKDLEFNNCDITIEKDMYNLIKLLKEAYLFKDKVIKMLLLISSMFIIYILLLVFNITIISINLVLLILFIIYIIKG